MITRQHTAKTISYSYDVVPIYNNNNNIIINSQYQQSFLKTILVKVKIYAKVKNSLLIRTKFIKKKHIFVQPESVIFFKSK